MQNSIYKMVCLVLLTFAGIAQKQDYHWIMQHTRSTGNIHHKMIFHSGKPDTVGFVYSKAVSHFKTLLSDKDGNFRFFSDGLRIFDRDFQVVEGSEELLSGEYYEFFINAGSRITQGGIMLPTGWDEEKVVLIHQSPVDQVRCEMQDCSMQLYFTLVDAEANDGRGRVIQKAIRISEDTLFSGMVSACRHANERDWWVIVWKQDTNEYICILVDEQGAEIDHRAILGDPLHWKANGSTQTVFSPDGSMYAYFNPRSGLHLYDFDRETGRLSRFRSLQVPFRHSLGGSVFSPNSQFLYINDNMRMYQLDTRSEPLEDGLFQLEDNDWEWSLTRNGYPTPYYQGQLAPDCKIYYSTGYSDSILHVIHNPDEKGIACNLDQRGYTMINRVGHTVPNLPHFRMGEDMERHCALINQISTQPIQSGTRLAIWPNPASDQLAIRLDPIPARGQATYTVYSISGKRVLSGIVSNPDNHLISLNGLSSGIYIIDIRLPDAAPIIERFVKGGK